MSYVNWYAGERDQSLATPPDFFAKLHERFVFTLDGAATEENALLPRFSTRGSPKPWTGERVFCNPPWSSIAAFVELAAHADFACLLVPARTNAKWFHRALELGARVDFFQGKLRFGQTKWNSPVDCVLLLFEHAAAKRETLAPYPDPPKRPWPTRPEKMTYSDRETWRGLTPESLAAFQAEAKAWERAVAETRKQHEEAAEAILAMIKDTGFPVSRQVLVPSRSMYRKHKTVTLRERLLEMLPLRPSMVAGTSIEESWLKNEQGREKEREAKKAAAARRDAAVQWLMERGKVYGRDFTADDAIANANGIAFDEAVVKKLAEGGPFAFEGHNCNDYRDEGESPCGGWDGVSHRCECGNRRVSWSGDRISFDGGYVYGEAY